MAYHSAGRRRDPQRSLHWMEVVCVLLVLAAVVALVAWIIGTAGGGVLKH